MPLKAVVGLEFTDDDRDRQWESWREYRPRDLLNVIRQYKYSINTDRVRKQRRIKLHDGTWITVFV